MPKHILPPNPRGHKLPSKQAASYKIRKHIVKILTFWIFIPPLRKQIQRNLRYWFGIDLKPESFAERHRYLQAQRKSLQHFAHTDLFSYHIVSLGCDCFCRTIPTLWGLKPRKNQGELGYPFDLSNNALPGILKNLREDFSEYFTNMYFNGKHWYLPQSDSLFCHEDDCGQNDDDKIRERFTRRIKNFQNVIGHDVPILFINRYCPASNLTKEKAVDLYNELFEILLKKRKNKPFKLLIIDYQRQLPQKNLNSEIYILAPDYLPETYVWNYPEYRMSAAGLRFETEFIEISQKLINQMKTDKKSAFSFKLNDF